ncbi:MAG: hypothetical protein AAGC92_11505 [Pseudomonadota bacterium]
MTHHTAELVLGLDSTALYVMGATQSVLMMMVAAGAILGLRAIARRALRAV